MTLENTLKRVEYMVLNKMNLYLVKRMAALARYFPFTYLFFEQKSGTYIQYWELSLTVRNR